jgi:hypothetical protein
MVGKMGRRCRADQFADRDQMRGDDAVERRSHLGIAVIDRGEPGVDLGLLQIGLGVVARRGRLIQRRLRDGLPLHQFGLTLEIEFGLSQGCLRAGFGGLRLFEPQFVGLGLDREQRGAFLHEGAVLVIDRLQEALHARDQIDALDRGSVAGRIEKARDRALHRQRDVHLRQRRRDKGVLFAAA